MEKKIYASYGSNMNIAQMKHRCPKARVIGNGELADHRLIFRGNLGGVANVEPSEGHKVPVVLWTITAGCEQALDRYEGYPRLYTKDLVTIKTADGEVEAMIYVMCEEYKKLAAMPSDYYFSVIWQGYKDNGLKTKPLLKALKVTASELKN